MISARNEKISSMKCEREMNLIVLALASGEMRH